MRNNNLSNFVSFFQDVEPNSPAYLAGLRPFSDYIIGADSLLSEVSRMRYAVSLRGTNRFSAFAFSDFKVMLYLHFSLKIPLWGLKMTRSTFSIDFKNWKFSPFFVLGESQTPRNFFLKKLFTQNQSPPSFLNIFWRDRF